jgi:hypothetical protein
MDRLRLRASCQRTGERVRRGQANAQRLGEIGSTTGYGVAWRCDSDKLPVLVALTMSMITGQRGGGGGAPRRSNLDARDKFGSRSIYVQEMAACWEITRAEISRVFTLLCSPPVQPFTAVSVMLNWSGFSLVVKWRHVRKMGRQLCRSTNQRKRIGRQRSTGDSMM